MLPLRPSRCILAAVAAATLGACHPGGQAEHTRAARRGAAVDAGAPVLAAVQNARAAIAAGDPYAAFNDVNLGIGYAVQLVGAESTLYPSEAAPPGYRAPSGSGGGQEGAGGGGSGQRRHGGGHHAAAGGQAGPAGAPPAVAAPASPAAPHTTAAAQRGAPTPVTSFDVQVKLVSAQAKLQARDVAGADADLQAIEAGADAHATPAVCR